MFPINKLNFRCYKAFSISLVSFVLISFYSYSQDGTLDLSFATNGKLTYLPPNGLIAEKPQIKVQSDLKILQVGTDATSDNFLVVRYNADGKSLDNTFNGNGIATASFNSCRAYSLCLQPDGKILAAGRTFNGSKHIFAVARFNGDGSLDNTFNGNGKATAEFSLTVSYAYSVAVQSDGKILLAGYTGFSGNTDFAIARFTSNGTLDNSFGSNGILTVDFNGKDDVANEIAIQKDGKILIAGSATNATTDIGILRLNSDGSFDNTFGSGGKLLKDIGNTINSCSSVALQSDGKIVVAGNTIFNPSTSVDMYSTVARFNTDGTTDFSFNTFGYINISYSSYLRDDGNSVGIQNDGKIVVGGNRFDGYSQEFAVARLNSDGTLDNSFNGTGKVVVSVTSGDDDGYSLASQGNKLILAGSSSSGFALIRLNNSAGFLVLPVKLTSFTAKQKNDGVQLEWITANEEQSSYFQIQKSRDGVNYTDIEKVAARGNSEDQHHYFFLDKTANTPNNYYRLKIVDIDGKVDYSKTIVLKMDILVPKVEVNPNPVKSVLNVKIDSQQAGTIKLLDVSGKLIKTIPFGYGYTNVSINISPLSKGLYFLKLADGKAVKIYKE